MAVNLIEPKGKSNFNAKLTNIKGQQRQNKITGDAGEVWLVKYCCATLDNINCRNLCPLSGFADVESIPAPATITIAPGPPDLG